MRQAYFVCLFLLATTIVHAQQSVSLRGVVADTSGNMLPFASIKIKSGTDSLFTQTKKTGLFTVSAIKSGIIEVEVSMVGFSIFLKKIETKAGDTTINIGHISLVPEGNELDNVVVTGVTPVKVMEDTVQYAVSAFKVREGAPAEDVIKKLPGITVDKDGNISSQGKAVSRIRVNGKDFFGGDVQTATQNLPADILDNIQIIEDYGDQANLTGIKNGEPETIININIKKDKNRGKFGNASLSAGTKNRYVAGLMANIFQDERQYSFLGSMNNTNTNTFNFNGGGRGGGARGGNVGSASRAGGEGNGLTNAQSAGLNYRDKWGDKISVYGSYSFSARSTETESTSQSEEINPKNIRFTNSIRSSQQKSQNHRVTFNMEYKIDSFNFLKLTPYLSYSNSNSSNVGWSEITQQKYYTRNNSKSSNKSWAPNAGGAVMFNHVFRKKGRNFNVNASIDYSDNGQDNATRNNYRNIRNNDSSYIPPSIVDTIQQQMADINNQNTRSSVRVSYTEPLGNSKTELLELSYEWNQSSTGNKRYIYDVDTLTGESRINSTQSNNFDYQFVTNRIGLNLKGNHSKYNYVVGFISQPSVLKGQSIGKGINTRYTNMNWIPTARFVYNLGKSHSLTASYSGTSKEPNFLQLQPVADSTNLNNIVTGNPNLLAEFNNNFNLRYNKADRVSGRSFFSSLGYEQTNNKIVNSRVNNASGTGRTTTYLNTHGFYRVSGNGSFTQPFSNRKYTATVNLAASYNNNISYTDNQRNKGRNWNIRPGAMFRLDLENIVDLNFNAGFTYYKTTTQYATFTNKSEAKTLQYGLSGKNYFFKDYTLGYDVAKTVNYGFSSGVASNPLIINLYAEYRFLKGKMATIKLQGYDLLNENTGITRSINATTITDSRNIRLARYFMLSFNMRLQKFGAGTKSGGQGRRDRAPMNPASDMF
jgi:hypothetical protein